MCQQPGRQQRAGILTCERTRQSSCADGVVRPRRLRDNRAKRGFVKMVSRAAGCVWCGLMVLLPSKAAAAQLPDGTRVPVRLLNVITSETSATGDFIEFVVTRDIVVSGEVVIPRGSHTVGVI